MAAPAHTARTTPTGFLLHDGYRSVVAFAANPSIQFWEKTVKPSGGDGGEPIPRSTMHNNNWRTMAPRSLLSKPSLTIVAGYDPDFIGSIINLVNKEGSLTQFFPDDSYEDFYGFLQKYEFGELKEGEMPEVTLTIAVTNWDPVNNVEAGPVFTATPGT